MSLLLDELLMVSIAQSLIDDVLYRNPFVEEILKLGIDTALEA